MLADCGYDGNKLIDYTYDNGGKAVIPSKKKGPNLNAVVTGGGIRSAIW